MPYLERMPEKGDVLRMPPLPDRVEPRVYLACNRIEFLLAEQRDEIALRCFRKYWRHHLILLKTKKLTAFRQAVLATLDGKKLYGPWWGPGLLPRRLVDSLIHVRRVIEHGDFEEVFS